MWLSPRVEMGRAVVRGRVSHVCYHFGFVLVFMLELWSYCVLTIEWHHPVSRWSDLWSTPYYQVPVYVEHYTVANYCIPSTKNLFFVSKAPVTQNRGTDNVSALPLATLPMTASTKKTKATWIKSQPSNNVIWYIQTQKRRSAARPCPNIRPYHD